MAGLRRIISRVPPSCTTKQQIRRRLSSQQPSVVTMGSEEQMFGEFITLLGGALADQAIPANAQETVRVRTVGVLMGLADDAEAQGRSMAFEQGLEREGWSLGQNLRIEVSLCRRRFCAHAGSCERAGGTKARLHSWPQHASRDGANACHLSASLLG